MIDFILNILKSPYPAGLATLLALFLLFSPGSIVDNDISGIVNDKVGHGIMFFGLAFLWAQYFGNNLSWLYLLAGLFVFAVLTEILQSLLPSTFSRSFEYFDILADSIGILTGLWVSQLFSQLTD